MPTITPASLLGAPKLQLFDNSGHPAAGYFLFTYIAGSSTPADTYSDSLLTTPNTNPIILDSAGRSTVYLQPGIGYKFILQNTSLTTIWTQDNVNDLSSLLFGYLISTGGAKAVASGYTIISTDLLVTVNSTATNPSIIQLPAASSRFLPIRIKNVGTSAITLTRAGADTFETGQTSYTIPPALSPYFPTVSILSDGVSNWWVFDGSFENGFGLRTTAGTLTNANMLALPTTPITLLAGQGAAAWARVWRLCLFPSFAAGAYTNIDATQSYIRAEYDGATNEPATQPILTRGAESFTQLNTFLSTTRTPVDLLPPLGPQSTVFGALPELFDRTNLLNAPVVLLANNNAAGVFTGGNAANTMAWLLHWTPEAL